MPVLSNNPLTVDGVTYERFGVSLAVSPGWKSDDVGPNVAMRLEYYTKDANNNVIKPTPPPPVEGEVPVDYSKSFVYSTMGVNEPAVEAKVRELMSIVQDLINLRNL